MEHYSENTIRFQFGHPDKRFITGVSEDAINADFDSAKSIIKKYFPKIKQSDSDFNAKGAGILGFVACQKHCETSYHPEKNTIFTKTNQKPEHKLLNKKPENLGQPILLDFESRIVVKAWSV